MHPLIRLISFLVIVVSIASGHTESLVLSFALLLIAWFILKRVPPKKVWTMLLRLRWLVLSIVILYGYFTPDLTQTEFSSLWLPSLMGLSIAFEKIGFLFAIILWADIWFSGLSREQFALALYASLRPLAWFGFNRDRFVLRLLLTMEELTQLNHKFEKRDYSQTSFKQRLGAYAQAAFECIRDTLAVKSVPPVIELTLLNRAPVHEWCVPLLLAGIFNINTLYFLSTAVG